MFTNKTFTAKISDNKRRLSALIITMKLSNPVKIVATDQAGFHVSGWKSDMLKQRRVFVLKRPFGVNM